MTLRKKVKKEVAKQAERYAISIAQCRVHGDGDSDCQCLDRTESYVAVIELLRSTDSKFPPSEKAKAQRAKQNREIRLSAMPHFVNDDLLEYMAGGLATLKELGHTPDITFDDGCCAAIYCEDCGRWGRIISNYAIDDEVIFGGQETGGILFKESCDTPYEPTYEETFKSIGRRKDEQ
jgi:hypothetical protein